MTDGPRSDMGTVGETFTIADQTQDAAASRHTPDAEESGHRAGRRPAVDIRSGPPRGARRRRTIATMERSTMQQVQA